MFSVEGWTRDREIIFLSSLTAYSIEIIALIADLFNIIVSFMLVFASSIMLTILWYKLSKWFSRIFSVMFKISFTLVFLMIFYVIYAITPIQDATIVAARYALQFVTEVLTEILILLEIFAFKTLYDDTKIVEFKAVFILKIVLFATFLAGMFTSYMQYLYYVTSVIIAVFSIIGFRKLSLIEKITPKTLSMLSLNAL